MRDTDTNRVPENRKWSHRFIRQLLTGLALLGGAIALVQYGVTLGKSGLEERIAKHEQAESALQQKVDDLQDAKTRSAEELAKLEKKLAVAESQLEGAKRTISELNSSLAKLKEERDAALAKLTENRPFLFFHMEPSQGAAKLEVVAKNVGTLPARIVHIRSQLWTNGEPGSFEASSGHYLVPRENVLGVSTFTIGREDAEGARQGKIDVRYMTCVIYEPARENDNRRWMADLWFTYNHDVFKPVYTYSAKNERGIDSKIRECDLDSLMPARWLYRKSN